MQRVLIVTAVCLLASVVSAQVIVPPTAPDITQLQQKAAAGDADAQFALARAYENGEGVPQNDDLAVKWYRAAAEQGNAAAQNSLGVMYSMGRGVGQDFRNAVDLYRKAAAQGYAAAQFNLGNAYMEGQGVPQDFASAIRWLRIAADSRDASALDAVKRYGSGPDEATAGMDVARLYPTGSEVPRNPVRAAEWLKKSAQMKYVPAQLALAELYFRGEGVPRDPQAAIKLLEHAAESDGAAAVRLAHVYLDGEGVQRDVGKGMKILGDAAKRDGDAAFALADMLWAGTIIAPDHNRALALYEFAGSAGHAVALRKLGTVYGEGQETKKDEVTSLMYFVLAFNLGDDASKALADAVAANVSPAKLAEAKQKASAWLRLRPTLQKQVQRRAQQLRSGR